jgi:hypothetical protein
MTCENKVRKWWSLGFKVTCGGVHCTHCHYDSVQHCYSFSGICWRCRHIVSVLWPSVCATPLEQPDVDRDLYYTMTEDN